MMTGRRLLTISNYIPEELIDVERFISYSGRIRINSFCTYVQNFIAKTIDDPNITGAVIPNSCDSIRIAYDYLVNYTGKFLYQLKHPLIEGENAVDYFSHELKKLKGALESHFNIALTDEMIKERIDESDKKMRRMKELYDNLNSLSYSDYLQCVNNSFTDTLANWKSHLNPESKKANTNEKKIYIIGPFLTDLQIIHLIEKFGGTIIGDYITNSQRFFSTALVEGGRHDNDVCRYIAGRTLAKYPSPTLNNFRRMIDIIIEEIRAKKIQGVIFIYQMFCEPYEYVYPALCKCIKAADVPLLKLQIENTMNQYENIQTRIETFMNCL